MHPAVTEAARERNARTFWFACTLLSLVFAVFCLAACAPHSSSTAQPFPSAFGTPGVALVASNGVEIYAGTWLAPWTALQAEAVSEIDAANYPSGWTIYILASRWQAPGYPDLLAVGQTWPFSATTWLAWRPSDAGPVVPAAGYEAQNAWALGEAGGAPAIAEIASLEAGQ
jgi:hypothetical protein